MMFSVNNNDLSLFKKLFKYFGYSGNKFISFYKDSLLNFLLGFII